MFLKILIPAIASILLFQGCATTPKVYAQKLVIVAQKCSGDSSITLYSNKAIVMVNSGKFQAVPRRSVEDAVLKNLVNNYTGNICDLSVTKLAYDKGLADYTSN